jgi:serine/threonine protein kinase
MLTCRHRFCPLKDLDQLVDEYAIRLKNWPLEEEGCPQIPEPFLWHVFECLCTAGLLLDRGAVERNPMWKTVVHRDLRPVNIFLAAPDAKRFSRYPTPKIGDFGLAVYAPPSDYDGDILEDCPPEGPPECVPPEQRFDMMQEEGWNDRWLLSSKSNVWGESSMRYRLIISSVLTVF